MKTVLVTGASGHLGRVVVRHLGEAGFTVLATTRTKPLLDELKSLVTYSQPIDLSVEQEVKDFISEVLAKYPALDAAVLLAGGFEAGTMEETDSEQLDRMIAMNFKSAFHVVRALWPHFQKRNSGRFVLIGAKAAANPGSAKQMVAYALSKLMVAQVTDMINASGHPEIRANLITPGTIDTEANRKAMPEADFSSWTSPVEIARQIQLFLEEKIA